MQKKNILVIKHGALGDMIFSLGAFMALRTHHKKDHLILLTSSPFKSLAEKTGYFDEIWIDDRPRLWKLWACWKVFKQLRNGNLSRIYDLQRSKRTKVYYRIVNWLFKTRPEWSGNIEGCTFPFTSPYQMKMHIYDAHAAQLEIAGITPTPLPSLDWLKEPIKDLKLPPKFFLMVPGCSASQKHKRWPAENFAVIAQRLVKEHKIIPVLLGTKEEEDAIELIKKACPKAINLMGKTTIWKIPSLARQAVGALGHDTGPMHMVTISDCPSTFLFSYSSIPARCGPKKSHSIVLKTDHLKDISVETVYKSLRFRNNPHHNPKV